MFRIFMKFKELDKLNKVEFLLFVMISKMLEVLD